MIKEFIEKWDKYKKDLEKYFKTTKQSEYDTYEKIVKLLFEKVINRDEFGCDMYNTGDIKTIDDGDYQGTQIFILHKDIYPPSVADYIYTDTYYGSCSGCDTLLSICGFGDELPDENQIEAYMTLSLHLLQKLNYFKED